MAYEALAVAGLAGLTPRLVARRVPRAAWIVLGDLERSLQEAAMLRDDARRDGERLREQCRSEGLARGHNEAVAEASRVMAEAQAAAREHRRANESRTVELACAIVSRIAPRLDCDALVADLVADALQAASAEQYLVIRVHPDAFDAVNTMLPRLMQRIPGPVRPSVSADPSLGPLGCVVESECGRVHAGLPQQLDALQRALTGSSA